MPRPKAILFIFGDGGHKEQTRRLILQLDLKSTFPDIKLISLSEREQKIKNVFQEMYFSPELRPKYKSKFRFLIIFLNALTQLFKIASIVSKYKVVVTISTGPGISIIPTYYLKITGAANIYLESWSRFENKSLAGKYLYPISDLFLIQNKELKNIYPNATYSGRL